MTRTDGRRASQTTRRVLLSLGLAALSRGRHASAQPAPLPAPSKPVVLTVSGGIVVTNGPGVAQFGTADLMAIDDTEVATWTPWYEGVQTFRGPKLAAVLSRLGARGTSIDAVALNDYTVSIPFSDAMEFAPILAVTRNGTPMPVRDKGPIFVIYPFDQKPSLKTALYFSRCIWQLSQLVIRP